MDLKPPFDAAEEGGDSSDQALPDVQQVLHLPDPLTEEEPTEIDLRFADERDRLAAELGAAFEANFLTRQSAYDVVKWPRLDANAPDYAHIAHLEAPDRFILSGDVLDRLIAQNKFVPFEDHQVVAFALRGAMLDNSHAAEDVEEVEILNIRPDHMNFRCLIGFYFLQRRKISVFSGSTVPCRKAIFNFVNGGDSCNMLPNGLYSYYIWRHKQITPALRLAESNKGNTPNQIQAHLESAQWVTVLRSKNDTIFGTKDKWDRSKPLDNVHCSYYLSYNPDLGSSFSSWGCLTVRGKKTPSDQWQGFQSRLRNIGSTKRVDLMLLTGKDAALAALGIDHPDILQDENMVRLRVGSQGPEVATLQRKLGLTETGSFDASTREKLTDFQRELSAQDGAEPSADGIYSPALDAITGWNILQDAGRSVIAALDRIEQSRSPSDDAAGDLALNGFTDIALRALEPVGDEYKLPSRGAAYDQTKDLASAAPLHFGLDPANEPQTLGTEFYATETTLGERFYVAKSTRYGSRRGLTRSSTLLTYDRFDAESIIGLWSHFMWPTIMGESRGRHITINSYDRAHFTWGFYQLAAHTPKDNLILLMRELLTLDSAAVYFPDLLLKNGRVHQATSSGEVDLEHEETVSIGDGTEVQIPRFMRYLNPSTTKINNEEVLNAAKFVHWTLNDPRVIEKTVQVSFRILRKKAVSYAARFGLIGKRPELAIWICDMFHQGRGSVAKVKDALILPTFAQQLDALSRIDTTGEHQQRLDTVKTHVRILMDEDRFKDVRFGEGRLSLKADA